MSKPLNPIAIGGFTMGALVLLVVGLLMFGGGRFFNTDKNFYVIYFDSSLNGLDVGAPVKMQGVKIGIVTAISLQLDPNSGKIRKAVIVEIDRNSFLGPGGTPLHSSSSHEKQLENRDMLVAKGYRARLEIQSLLTGLLYVDFDKHPEMPAQFTGVDYQGLIELPSVPTTVDEIRNTAEELVKKLRTLPLEDMIKDFADTLKVIRSLVGSDELKKSNAALAKTLEGMEKTLDTLNRNLEPLLKETHQTMHNANGLVQDVRQGVKPLLAATEKTLVSANAAFDEAKSAAGTVGSEVGPGTALNVALIAIKDAARSLKELTDYLDRHPESLILGKKKR